MNSRENSILGKEDEPQGRSSIESRRSRMSRMTSSSVNIEPERPPIPAVPPLLPETKLDVSFSLDQIIGDMKFEGVDIDPKKKEHLEKRQSNVMKLAQENEKLNAELKAMSERLAAAERRTQAILAQRERKQQQQQQQLESSEGQQGTSARAF